MLDDSLIRDIADPNVLLAELDALLDGYTGWPEEDPGSCGGVRRPAFRIILVVSRSALPVAKQSSDPPGIRSRLHSLDAVAAMIPSVLIYANCQGEELWQTGAYMQCMAGRLNFKWIPLHLVNESDWETKYGPHFMADVITVWEQVEASGLTPNRAALQCAHPARVPGGEIPTVDRHLHVAFQRQ